MQKVIDNYLETYLPRKEIVHRLPVSLPISKVWPELQRARRTIAQGLPLHAESGLSFWWVLNKSIEQQTEEVISLARRELMFDRPEYETAFREAVWDEAVYSSIIEGAFTTRKEAHALLREGRAPKNKSEQMVKNNYEALTYVLEHIDEPITMQTIFDIYALVTKNTLDEDVALGSFRQVKVFVKSGHGDIVHTAPEAKNVERLMNELLSFIQESDLSPLIKACIAHFYFVYVHPFEDGNGRTARALSYMMLLQAGYDFFRYFSISGVLAEERARYYKAMKDVEDDDFDMTYFIDYYTGMLARAVRSMEERLVSKVVLEQTIERLSKEGLNQRILDGAKWILTSKNGSVTIKSWQKKFNVVTETARQDLFKLEAAGVVKRKTEGRQFVFEVVRESEPLGCKDDTQHNQSRYAGALVSGIPPFQ